MVDLIPVVLRDDYPVGVVVNVDGRSSFGARVVEVFFPWCFVESLSSGQVVFVSVCDCYPAIGWAEWKLWLDQESSEREGGSDLVS